MVSSVKLTEKRLVQMTQVLNRINDNEIQTTQNIDIDLDQQTMDKVRSQLYKLNIELLQLKELFELPSGQLNIRHMIHSYATMVWEELLNTTSQNLRGYGKMEESNAKKLDGQVQKMVEIVEQIIQATK